MSNKIFNAKANQAMQPFALPDLPFSAESFGSDMSKETFSFHHGKHHNAYVVNLNKLLEGKTEFAGKNLEDVVIASYNKPELVGIFNNAAQVWNHSFFWHSMKPNGGGKPSAKLMSRIEKDFGSYDNFANEFKNAGATQFGSGWAWLILDLSDDKLKVVKTANADTPFVRNQLPLITIDVWEHAYYLDYQNRRPDYIQAFLDKLVNWDFAEANLTA